MATECTFVDSIDVSNCRLPDVNLFAILSWPLCIYRDNIPATPVYSTNVVHAGDDGDIGTLIDIIRKGADFRLVIGNGLRIPAANLEIDENATKVVEMGIFESSRQVVDSKGNDIYEFLSSVSHINTFNPLHHMLYLEHCIIFYK